MKLLVGSIFAIVAAFALFFIPGFVTTPSVLGFQFSLALGTFVAIVTAIALLLWGLPLHFALSKAKIRSGFAYALAGFIAGPLYVFVFKPFGLDPLASLLRQSLICGVSGVTSALVFWVVVVRPNQSFKQDALKRAP